MIVRTRTAAQATKIAEATGCPVLPAHTRSDGRPGKDRCVDVGVDFEAHREAVESVTVMFELFDGDTGSYAAGGDLGAKVDTGWTITAAKFEVEWPADPGVVRSHFGARRKAYNWALGRVNSDMDARSADAEYGSIDW